MPLVIPPNRTIKLVRSVRSYTRSTDTPNLISSLATKEMAKDIATPVIAETPIAMMYADTGAPAPSVATVIAILAIASTALKIPL